MAENQYYNKIIVNGQTKIDLTGDTITPADVINGKAFHDRSGAPQTGSCTYDADTSDANATAAEILSGSTAYVAGTKVTGTMTNNSSINLVIDDVDDELTIPAGYHDGGGKAKIDPTEASKLIAANIREGVTVLGVTGTMSGTEAVVAGSPTVTPSFQQQVIVPDSTTDPAQNYLAQVTVNAIPVTETDNEQGGKTLTIG